MRLHPPERRLSFSSGCWIAAILTMLILCESTLADQTKPLELTLRSRSATANTKGGSETSEVHRDAVSWSPAETAVIVCDVWDSHHCFRAVQRVNEMVPRMDRVIGELRRRGVTVIHAPSGCMNHYQNRPARIRAEEAPDHPLPDKITQWCHVIPTENQDAYPIDQSDGGEDDTPEEHEAWVQQLEDQGRDPKAPWQRQHKGLSIDSSQDFITDRGDEVWNILQSRGIENVILLGVHTNMCVLGRPFGLRQMVKNGKNTVLMRDMTDTMYNPKAAPYVAHAEGTRLIVEYIERYVCPTITSDQIIGGKSFQFAEQRAAANEPES